MAMDAVCFSSMEALTGTVLRMAIILARGGEQVLFRVVRMARGSGLGEVVRMEMSSTATGAAAGMAASETNAAPRARMERIENCILRDVKSLIFCG